MKTKRTLLLATCFMGCFFVGHAQHINPRQPKKTMPKTYHVVDKETQFVRQLMQQMTLAEKIGQLSQYVGGIVFLG